MSLATFLAADSNFNFIQILLFIQTYSGQKSGWITAQFERCVLIEKTQIFELHSQAIFAKRVILFQLLP